MPHCGGKAAVQKSKKIDKELQKSRNQLNEEIRLLLLGPGESGKSTIFKQMKIIQVNGGYSQDELMGYKYIIYTNTITQMKTICNYSFEKQMKMSSEENQKRAERIKDVNPSDIWGSEVAMDIQYLWKDPTVLHIFKIPPMKRGFSLNDSTEYFFDAIERLASPNYIPLPADVLRCRARSTGIDEAEFQFNGLTFKMIDVGGQRAERRKWIHCFDRVTAVLFCVGLSDYDQVLREDLKSNRMEESLALWTEIVNVVYFKKTAFILFFNKNDLFIEKIKTVDLKICFENYTGGCNEESARNFILARFLEQHSGEKMLFHHFTVAVDTENVSKIFKNVKDIIVEKILGQVMSI